MDKDNVPFLRPPLGGFAGHQRFRIPDENEHYHHHRYSHDTRGVKGNVRCQVLRSVGEWSLGTDTEVCYILCIYVTFDDTHLVLHLALDPKRIH